MMVKHKKKIKIIKKTRVIVSNWLKSIKKKKGRAVGEDHNIQKRTQFMNYGLLIGKIPIYSYMSYGVVMDIS